MQFRNAVAAEYAMNAKDLMTNVFQRMTISAPALFRCVGNSGRQSRPAEGQCMRENVELYDSAYGNYESELYRQIRMDTYGEDYGQTSWVTTDESREIPQLLKLTPDSSVLEIGCGSGEYALHLAKTFGCRVTGLDINALGIRNANQLALQKNLAPQVHFAECDVSENLPFKDESFDAVFANDVLCHVPHEAAASGRNVSRAEGRHRPNAFQRRPGNRRDGFERRNRHSQFNRVLCLQSPWRK